MIAVTIGYVMYVIIAGNVYADVDFDVNDTETLTLESGIVHLNAVVSTLTHSRNLAKLTNVDDYARIPDDNMTFRRKFISFGWGRFFRKNTRKTY